MVIKEIDANTSKLKKIEPKFHFNREINGRHVTVNDIKYFAKIELQRAFKGTEFQVKENHLMRPKYWYSKIRFGKIDHDEMLGSIKTREQQIL